MPTNTTNPWMDQEFMNTLGLSMLGSISPGGQRGNWMAPALEIWAQRQRDEQINKRRREEMAREMAWKEQVQAQDQARWEHERSMEDPWWRARTLNEALKSAPEPTQAEAGMSEYQRAQIYQNAVKAANEACTDIAGRQTCSPEEHSAKAEEIYNRTLSTVRGAAPTPTTSKRLSDRDIEMMKTNPEFRKFVMERYPEEYKRIQSQSTTGGF